MTGLVCPVQTNIHMDISAVSVRHSARLCSHCENQSPLFGQWIFDNNGQVFCCEGCRTVYTAINGCGLNDYYRIRSQQSAQLSPALMHEKNYHYLDSESVIKEFLVDEDSMYFYVSGLQCAACVWILEKIPELEPDIANVRIDGFRKLALVKITPKGHWSKFAAAAQKFGYAVRPIRADDNQSHLRNQEKRDELKKIAITAVGAGNLMLLSFSVYLGADPAFAKLFNWFSVALMVPVLFYGARSIFLNSWSSLRARVPSLDLPLAIAIAAGTILSVFNLLVGKDQIYFDSVSILILLINSSRYFVARLQEKFLAHESEGSSLLPSFARKLSGAEEVFVSAKSLQAEDIFQVLNDEVMPADGVVESGRGWVNQVVLTGEPLPKVVTVGSEVFAGTKLEGGEIVVRTHRSGRETKVGRLQSEAVRASLLKSHVAKALDKWAQKFTYVILALGAIVILVSIPYDFGAGFERALSLFIVACPCAIAFGAPLVYSQALSRATELGIFVKSADVWERIREIKNVFFDKTGTLTRGELHMVKECSTLTPSDVRALVAIESRSSHPAARAIVKHFSDRIGAPLEVGHFKSTPGVGVEGEVQGRHYKIQAAQVKESDGQLVISVEIFRDGFSIGTLEMQDELRPESGHVVSRMNERGMNSYILSGDRADNVEYVGQRLGFLKSQLFSNLRPEEKEKILSSFEKSMMIGDGINDSIAMARAHLSVIVGGSMERALNVADVFLTRDGLGSINKLWMYSNSAEKSLRMIRNFSIGYNTLTAGLSVAGLISPVLAAILMPASSVAVLTLSYIGMRSVWKS